MSPVAALNVNSRSIASVMCAILPICAACFQLNFDSPVLAQRKYAFFRGGSAGQDQETKTWTADFSDARNWLIRELGAFRGEQYFAGIFADRESHRKMLARKRTREVQPD